MQHKTTARRLPGTVRGYGPAALRQAAYRLGSIDALAGRPERDMADAGSAWLMTALGQHGPTTQANHGARTAMCEAYSDGWHDASSALGGTR